MGGAGSKEARPGSVLLRGSFLAHVQRVAPRRPRGGRQLAGAGPRPRPTSGRSWWRRRPSAGQGVAWRRPGMNACPSCPYLLAGGDQVADAGNADGRRPSRPGPQSRNAVALPPPSGPERPRAAPCCSITGSAPHSLPLPFSRCALIFSLNNTALPLVGYTFVCLRGDDRPWRGGRWRSLAVAGGRPQARGHARPRRGPRAAARLPLYRAAHGGVE